MTSTKYFLPFFILLAFSANAKTACDKACLENIADQYRAAYIKHDTTAIPLAKKVRFSENNVEMKFPDASWDTVSKQVGPALTISDPKTGNVAIYMAMVQMDTPGFLAVRLKVSNGKISEIEHILSTKRNLSAPPTPIGDIEKYQQDPSYYVEIPKEQRISRERLIAHADGYFSTLNHNDGEIRGTRFSADAIRLENGLKFNEIEKGFKLGYYRFNDNVRREPVLVDEERQIVLCRGFIDHKGVLDEYTLTDGTRKNSVYREPHSWAFLEMFKVKDDQIIGVQAVFIGAPYNMTSPWSK
jgi:hypothetical protein